MSRAKDTVEDMDTGAAVNAQATTSLSTPLNTQRDSAALWQDCDLLYAKLQPLCLQLQQQHGVCVNLLLLAYWCDEHGLGLTPMQWQQLQLDVKAWEEVLLLPFRGLRQSSKCLLDTDEYQQMLALELMLERKSQRHILVLIKQTDGLVASDKQTALATNQDANQSMDPSANKSANKSQANLSHYLGLFGLAPQQFSQLAMP
ncbi:DUF2390 domain-containing protein [Shewanella sp. SNU WT4]|uniref:DUF2390 domain-containing protein n=1 Tax=Shewanella sp. SNU WT4 TaxID=2590015 RepID=UPI00112C2B10|nr:DUF2390 domain-containing protein [Shewanella sp. SNU WT4]QDF66101.1 DUF2390 domain-containing protein [Shewanella sp. SNU WT4]